MREDTRYAILFSSWEQFCQISFLILFSYYPRAFGIPLSSISDYMYFSVHKFSWKQSSFQRSLSAVMNSMLEFVLFPHVNLCGVFCLDFLRASNIHCSCMWNFAPHIFMWYVHVWVIVILLCSNIVLPVWCPSEFHISLHLFDFHSCPEFFSSLKILSVNSHHFLCWNQSFSVINPFQGPFIITIYKFYFTLSSSGQTNVAAILFGQALYMCMYFIGLHHCMVPFLMCGKNC